MGGAIIRHIAPQKKWNILLYDIQSDVARNLALKTASKQVELQPLIEQSDIIVLALKPQVLVTVFEQLSAWGPKQWISMAAGVSLETLTGALKSENVIRIMPNLAASAGFSVTAMSSAAHADAAFIEEALSFLQSFGEVHSIDEALFSAFTGLSGSGIAVVLEFMHAMALGGVHEGFSYHQALEIALGTCLSAVKLQSLSAQHPQQLVSQICSPQGTTIEAIKHLGAANFQSTVMQAVEAASQKAKKIEEITSR